MNVTKDVILDLLPLYLTDEVSADTHALIEEYLVTDPELAGLVKKQKAALSLPGSIPAPLSEEAQLKAYKKSKLVMFITIILLALLMTAIIGVTLMAFLLST
ncbi:MAG: hypothetical protein JXA25_03945 [Anaerolineales bacterium]|nr:hypothetical protein [Anaerolineales bacterium]